MSNPLYQLYVAHVEWKGRRKDLKGQEHRHFHRWVGQNHPELIAALGGGAQFRQQCVEVQRGGKTPAHQGIGMATLERYSDQLVAMYMSSPNFPQQPFSEFLADVLQRCRSEAVLVQFLTGGLGHP